MDIILIPKCTSFRFLGKLKISQVTQGNPIVTSLLSYIQYVLFGCHENFHLTKENHINEKKIYAITK